MQSFNEAAAYHCGKHRARDGVRGPQRASMRPQHITAENPEGRIARLRQHRASMRPQHITAENWPEGLLPRCRRCGFNEAAAYHCGKPGRPARGRCAWTSFNEAAAYHCGKLGDRRAREGIRWGFNEAAAYHCGKHDVVGRHAAGVECASMRPQHITAENMLRSGRARPGPGRFNEAAAYHCGKRHRAGSSSARPCGFNEAAAYHCGKHAPSRRPFLIARMLQ